ncbi:MAG: glutamine synthetase beta-grasp domain-containing protein [Gammaproteobacteria bacterium]|nr:glutamine synthetase beta-grasp domain-containing protein [Gammaproteobacteria bacterium]
MIKRAEYIWLDGAVPHQEPRSKTRMIFVPENGKVDISIFPQWSFDGSSTNQADGNDSDLLLEPVNFVIDPVRDDGSYLVLCEVLNGDGTPHTTNHRAQLRDVMENGGAKSEPWFGVEQEYTLLKEGRPLGWPANGFPAPQGPYYCGVGTDKVYGRDLIEAHAAACIKAGIMIYGINAEVMPAQWEFQIGYRGVESESADPLMVADHLWLARWLLHRLTEEHGCLASFEVKPVKGDWNGAGAHTNFSTKEMRDPAKGGNAIKKAIERLKANHESHIIHYGHALEERLTGLHETCSIDEFRGGVADRGASIRIPRHVEEKGFGYLEDRRPGANCDPYIVFRMLVETVCNLSREGLPQAS